MRYAIKFAYDGSKFDGYARQPGKRTVEGDIIKAMKFLGMIESVGKSRLEGASRTDRGVSAAGNVIALDTEFRGDAILKALNSNLEGIVCHGIADVPDDFNPRHARQRWYRYFFQADGLPPTDELEKAAAYFTGKHDFRVFSKKDADKNTVLAIDSIEFSKRGKFIIVDIRAHRFLWELVRRLLSAILETANDRLGPDMAEEMLAGIRHYPRGLKPLPPEFLVLMDVIYDFEFEHPVAAPDYFGDEARYLKQRSDVMKEISEIIRV
ncbi:MAG: tRNA pseudouridine(38-40) synthase TruA [Candidatus Thermoplasmatota archaeon]|nr:tRNA pseudouridine(38-40) synthase TruA [Euryarchaeota archaeon]MBU4031518.1 tRNA pseudouridine(38-40) synthase TruA [Candidatus Thermoplasmatota archaeon]MBU4072009.1 tRNA pseudouridine(38-40) synthase TruA [Candidatus Thermoplasmatota archaeon]MBU4144540.1 tRNA pseudouridine(38-40) synthase TruA [Candidatus Thermoplasmatota archaeon]MBU4592089.1 tRNA pseudouridine(38-40) synthase TruA [Candidatus Thermoplasmatota archaeon]